MCFIHHPVVTTTDRPKNAVRKTVNVLIGIEKDDDAQSFDLSRFPTTQTVEAYQNGDVEEPDIRDEFMPIYWIELRCPWNSVLAERFVALLLQEHPEFARWEDDIRGHFWNRLEHFKYLFRLETKFTRSNDMFSPTASR